MNDYIVKTAKYSNGFVKILTYMFKLNYCNYSQKTEFENGIFFGIN